MNCDCDIINPHLKYKEKLIDYANHKKIESENENEKEKSEIEKKDCKSPHMKFWLPSLHAGDNNLNPEIFPRSRNSNQGLNKYFEKLKEEKDSKFFASFEKVLPMLSPVIKEIKNICQLLDDQKTWAVISADRILIARVPIELMLGQIIYEIPFCEIKKILTVVPDFSMIRLIKVRTDGTLSPMLNFDLIFNGESSIRDRIHFISSLLTGISSSIHESIQSVGLDVICFSSILDMPSSQNSMRKYLSQEISIREEGFCLAWKIESSLEFMNECMMQKGNEIYQPVIITLQDNILFIGQTKGNLRIKTWEILTLERVENPRPHSICLIWKSMTLNLAWNNAYIVAQFFDMLNISRRKFSNQNETSNPAPAHIFVTDSTLFLFSTEFMKNLLLRIPLLNIERLESSKTGIAEMEKSRTLIIETDSLEADEDTLIYEDVNAQWCLRFNDEIELQKYANLLFPC